MCINCNDPLQINLPQGPTGPAGPTGPQGSAGTAGAAGAAGATGAQGPYGGVTFEYLFDAWSASSTSSTKLAISGTNYNTPLNTASVYINAFSVNNNVTSASLTNFYSYIQNITSATKGFLKIFKKADNGKFLLYKINSVSLVGSNYVFAVTLTATNLQALADFTANDSLLVTFTLTGDSGVGTVPAIIINSPAAGPMLTGGTINGGAVPTALSNTNLTAANGTTFFAYGGSGNAVVTSNAASVLPTTDFSNTTGFYTTSSAGYYVLNFEGSFDISTSPGWSPASGTGFVACSILDGSSNLYASQSMHIPSSTYQRYLTVAMSSGVVYLNAGVALRVVILNLTGRTYTNQTTDVIRFSIQKVG